MLKIFVRGQMLALNVRDRLRNFGKDERGVTAMEYGVIAAVTVVVVGGVAASMFSSMGTLWGKISGILSTAATQAS